jgi:5-methylcytosine-specific restriction endonuclease McrA
MQKSMIRVGVVPVDEVLPHVVFEAKNPRDDSHRMTFCGESVCMSSLRLQCFARSGLSCCVCGIRGVYFGVERLPADKRCHLNLYARNLAGEEVLLTKDHILPRSKGGRDILSNLQTMCMFCNVAKGDKVVECGT